MKYLVSFLVMLIVDYVWALYIKGAANNKPIMAAFAGGFIFVAGSFVTIQYVEDRLVLIPATIGGMLGTYLSVRKK